MIRSRRDGARTTLEHHFLIGSADKGVEYVTEALHLTPFTDEQRRSAFEQAAFEVELAPKPPS